MFKRPMLMTACDQPFDNEQFLFEPLIDGQRLLLSFMNRKARLFTKHGYEVTRQYPELLKLPLTRPVDVVLDGELSYMNPDTGRLEFAPLIDRYKMTKETRIREGALKWPVRYYVFDLLYYNGVDLRSKPLLERKRLLQALLEDNGFFMKLPFVAGNGTQLWRRIAAYELEGMAGKRSDSRYLAGRSAHWLKMTNAAYSRIHMDADTAALL